MNIDIVDNANIIPPQMVVEAENITEYVMQTENLTVSYHSKPVLLDINIKIPKGMLTAIIGPNGAGKTTLIKSMLGLIKPICGSIKFFANKDIQDKCLKNRIAYVPQSESVDWDFPATVLDVVLMGRYGSLGWFKRPKKNDIKICIETLEKVGMGKYKNRQINQLSGGQQQRVFLARALVQQADLYFMDEPFKGVDAKTEKAIVTLLKELKEGKKTVVVVHHDLQTVREYFNWVTLINKKIIANGYVNDVFNEENLQKAYRSSGLISKGGI